MLIPGKQWVTKPVFLVYGTHGDFCMWDWAMCLGVALSIAGALTSAYSLGHDRGYNSGFNAAWNYVAGQDGA